MQPCACCLCLAALAWWLRWQLLACDEPLDAGSVGFGIEGRSAPGGGLLPVEDDGPANGVSSIRWGSQIDSDLNVEKRCWSETAFGHTRQQSAGAR